MTVLQMVERLCDSPTDGGDVVRQSYSWRRGCVTVLLMEERLCDRPTNGGEVV